MGSTGQIEPQCCRFGPSTSRVTSPPSGKAARCRRSSKPTTRGLYVLKFRGAGQGARALVAELVAGRIAGPLGWRCRRIVLGQPRPGSSRGPSLTPRSTRSSTTAPGSTWRSIFLPGRSPSIRSCRARLPISLHASSGSTATSPTSTARCATPNMLMWHRRLWLIDHGATLYFHHSPGWESAHGRARGAVPGDQGSRPAAAREHAKRGGRDIGGCPDERCR